jgi:hypothetical protein
MIFSRRHCNIHVYICSINHLPTNVPIKWPCCLLYATEQSRGYSQSRHGFLPAAFATRCCWTWTWTSTHIQDKMIPSRGFQAVRGVAPRLYQQQCRNVNILLQKPSKPLSLIPEPSSHRELSPEPPPSPLLVLPIAYCATLNGDHEPLVSPPQSLPSDTPPQSLQLPRPRLQRHPSIPPAPLPTTLTPSHSTTSKSPPPAMPSAT